MQEYIEIDKVCRGLRGGRKEKGVLVVQGGLQT